MQIVTAAHCVYGQLNPNKYTIDIGVTSRVTTNSWSLTNLKVSNVIMHPNYDDDTIDNDIALIKLTVYIYNYMCFIF